MSNLTQTVSVVMPVHNESECLSGTYDRVVSVCRDFRILDLDYEIIFVNDGSSDGSSQILDQFVERDANVRVVHLTRNFGHQPAVSAGIAAAVGDAVIVMDADLQDPPEVLPQFIEKWRSGCQVVYAVRRKRKESWAKRVAYWSFYRVFASLSEIDMPVDSGDFCLMDRSAVDLLLSLPERQRFVRGLRTWIGLNQVGLEYERDARAAGTPSYGLGSLVKLAMDGLVSFSVVPLRLTTRLGVLGVGMSFLIGLWVVIDTVFIGMAPRGWASLACLVLLLSSIQMISLGIIGEYLSRIFIEVKGRPTYLIERVSQRKLPRQINVPSSMAPVPKNQIQRPV